MKNFSIQNDKEKKSLKEVILLLTNFTLRQIYTNYINYSIVQKTGEYPCCNSANKISKKILLYNTKNYYLMFHTF